MVVVKPLSVRFKSMGSPCEIRIIADDQKQGAQILEMAVHEVNRLHNKYSRYQADSVITRINQSAGTGKAYLLDEETKALLNYADVCFQQSEGLFDVTSGVLREIWNFKAIKQTAVLPTSAQIDRLLKLVGWQKVEWDADCFYLPLKKMEIDFGGIVKEYAADAVASLCQSQGITSGLVDLGGDIRIIGPWPGDEPWNIFIQSPDKNKKYCTQLALKNGGIATSGVYERFIEIKGKRYSHLLNPITGWPIEESVASLTVLADQCVIAGSISTMGMLQGKDCLRWMQENIDLPFWCCMQDGEVVDGMSH